MRFIVFISTLAIVSAESELVVKTLKGSVVGYLEKSGQIAIFKVLFDFRILHHLSAFILLHSLTFKAEEIMLSCCNAVNSSPAN
jgi:hypothetical protein